MHYEGTERRKDCLRMADELEAIRDLVTKLQNDLNKIAVIEERIKNWMDTTEGFRKILQDELRDLKDTLRLKDSGYSSCKEERIRASNAVKWLWLFFSGLTAGLVWLVTKR